MGNNGLFGTSSLADYSAKLLGYVKATTPLLSFDFLGPFEGCTRLKIVACYRNSLAAAGQTAARMQFNHNSSNLYCYCRSNRYGASVAADTSYLDLGECPNDGSAQGIFGTLMCDVFNPNELTFKPISGMSTMFIDASQSYTQTLSHLWKSANKINHVSIYISGGGFAINSWCALYGCY